MLLPTRFETSYNPTYAHASKPLSIIGMKPSHGSSDTCYVFIPGTAQDIRDLKYYNEFLAYMVAKGHCSVAIMYPESHLIQYPSGGGWIKEKAAAIFDEERRDSAITSVKNAGCKFSKIIVHGFSQGAHIAAMAHNVNKSVTGVLMFSGGCQANLLDNCNDINKDKTTIPRSRIRDISVQKDGTLGCGFMDWGRSSVHEVKMVTGVDCDLPCSDFEDGTAPSKCCELGTYGNSSSHCPIKNCKDQCTCDNIVSNCVEDGGGGYYILKHSEYPNKGHMWFLTSDMNSVWPEAWTTSEPWNIGANLDWLDRTTRHPALSQMIATTAATDSTVVLHVRYLVLSIAIAIAIVAVAINVLISRSWYAAAYRSAYRSD